VGLVVEKNNGETPDLVAVIIQLLVVIEDIERIIGQEIEFCSE